MTSTTPDPDQAMTILEVAALWGVSRRTVRVRVQEGALPMFKVGRATRFRRCDVLAFMTANTRQSA